MKTILLATAVSVALVGQAMPANAQEVETKTEYDPNDPFFGTGAVGTVAEAYIVALEQQKIAHEEYDAALAEWNAATKEADEYGGYDDAPTEVQDRLDAAAKALGDPNNPADNGASSRKNDADEAVAKAANDYNNLSVKEVVPAVHQTVQDLRGPGGLLDQEVIVTNDDGTKTTVVQQGRVSQNTAAIA